MRVSDKKKQLNNSGFSLVEVLVAIVILAIISLPVLSTFSNAARINSRARRTENANTAINNIIEEAKVTQLDDLLKGNGEYDYSLVENNGNPYYVVKTKNGSGTDSYFKGVNDQKFYIRTTFDKNRYTENRDSTGVLINDNINSANDINSYGLSVYADINSGNNYVYRDDTLDNQARDYFKSKMWGTYDEKKIIKKTTIKISLEYTGEDKDTPMYAQNMKIRVVYTYGTDTRYEPFVNETSMRVNTFSATLDEDIQPSNNGGKSRFNVSSELENNAKSLYVFYMPFNSNGTTTGKANQVYANDEIEIRYSMPEYTGDGTKEVVYKDLNVYLLQQEKLDSSNNKIVVNGDSKVKVARVYGAPSVLDNAALSDTSTLKDKVKVFSTIDGGKSTWNAGDTTKTSDSLFRMKVEVWMYSEGKDNNYYTESNRIATVTTTKEN